MIFQHPSNSSPPDHTLLLCVEGVLALLHSLAINNVPHWQGASENPHDSVCHPAVTPLRGNLRLLPSPHPKYSCFASPVRSLHDDVHCAMSTNYCLWYCLKIPSNLYQSHWRSHFFPAQGYDVSRGKIMESRIEVVPLMRDSAVKGPPILTPLINMSQFGEARGWSSNNNHCE